MSDSSTRAIETRTRRRLEKRGEALVKYRPNSQWYAQYGPYAVVDATTAGILEASLQLDDLDAARRSNDVVT